MVWDDEMASHANAWFAEGRTKIQASDVEAWFIDVVSAKNSRAQRSPQRESEILKRIARLCSEYAFMHNRQITEIERTKNDLDMDKLKEFAAALRRTHAAINPLRQLIEANNQNSKDPFYKSLCELEQLLETSFAIFIDKDLKNSGRFIEIYVALLPLIFAAWESVGEHWTSINASSPSIRVLSSAIGQITGETIDPDTITKAINRSGRAIRTAPTAH